MYKAVKATNFLAKLTQDIVFEFQRPFLTLVSLKRFCLEACFVLNSRSKLASKGE
jgi:hypothetical protein